MNLDIVCQFLLDKMAQRFYTATSSLSGPLHRSTPKTVAIKGKRSRGQQRGKRYNANAFSDTVTPLSIQPKRPDEDDVEEHLISEFPFDEPEDPYEKAKKRRRAWAKAINGRGTCQATKDFFRRLPKMIWNCFIVTLLIPKYRPEWGKYMAWDITLVEQKVKKKAKSKFTHTIFTKLTGTKSKTSKKSRKKRRHATDMPPQPEPHDHFDCIPVRINVSGLIFEPQLRTLKQFPNTLLGNPRRMAQFYDPARDEFFFDRHRSSFECIMYYYNTGGILRRPPGVAHAIFLDEVKFFDLGPEVLQGLQNIRVSNNDGSEDNPLPENLLQRKLWLLFEYAESSYQSRIVACISIAVVIVSIFDFCIETMPAFAYSQIESDKSQTLSDPLFFLETWCIIFFVVEYLMRALTCPHFFTFVKDMSNLIDLIAILPYFLGVWYQFGAKQSKNKKIQSKTVSLTVFRIIRLVRVFRILKLSRHNRGLKVLGKTLKASIRELGLLVFFLMLGLIIFSSAIYFAEAQYSNTPFTSIPRGFWFSVVTMTTLGYGDIVPVGPYGKIIGALCAITGVLTISLPVPVIVSNFNMFYSSEDMNKQQAAAAKSLLACDHIEHCPYYSAWYTSDGNVAGENKVPTTDTEGNTSNALRWLIGDQRPDYSDSDFDELLHDKLLRKSDINKKQRRMSRRASRRMSRKSFKI